MTETETQYEHLIRNNVHFVHVDKDDVVDETHGNTDREAFRQMNNARTGYVTVADSRLVKLGDWLDRSDMTIKDPIVIEPEVDGTVVRNLPVPCSVSVDDGPFHEVGDGVAELDLDHRGTYRVRVAAPRHAPCLIEVTVP